MFSKLKVAIFLICMMMFVLVACGDNGDAPEENGNGYTEETPAPTPTLEPTPTPEPEPEVIDFAAMYVPADGSISLRVETLGNQQWDGAQVPTAALGLEVGNIYEFSMDIFTAVAQGDLDVGVLVQTSGPLWRHIMPSPVFYVDAEPEWHHVTGILDLSVGVTAVPDNIQIVKNNGAPNPSANATFYIDNFSVSRDGEIIAFFNFEDGNSAPFFDSGQAIVATGVAIGGANAPTPEWDMTLPSLAARWEDYFIFGNILEPSLIEDNPFNVIEMYLHHYNAVTAENAMKVAAVSGGGNQHTRPANLNLAGSRVMVNFAEEHGLYMVGHTLVWHEQSAPWLYRNPATTEILTRAEAMENMRWFIQQYAGYFGDRIDAWDVTNEVFTNGGAANVPSGGPDGSPVYNVGTWQRALRNYVPWYHAFANGADFDAGERAYDYIYYAFVFARRYAPTALLIYNDFNEEMPQKRNAMAYMTEELNERWHADSENNPAYNNPDHPDYGRLLIEAIGMQAHYNHNTNLNNVHAALERFAQTGARIHVTELDIHFNQVVPAPFTMTEAQLIRQAEMFAQLFQWYTEFADYIDRVSIWGREDGSSWRGAGAATHFDRFYRPKPAFWAIYDPNGWRDRID
ncbi:MAG: endo-1,4-beta-xylanase [Defluviitaleaceae bacterium]|nr:endo-1,4-beta-xylanase [Defluviitaleaceae bacterium]